MHDTSPTTHSCTFDEAKKAIDEGRSLYYLIRHFIGYTSNWQLRWAVREKMDSWGPDDAVYYDNYWRARAEALKRNAQLDKVIG